MGDCRWGGYAMESLLNYVQVFLHRLRVSVVLMFLSNDCLEVNICNEIL